MSSLTVIKGINIEGILKLHRFGEQFYVSGEESYKKNMRKISKIAEKFNFQIPKNPFLLFYVLGEAECDVAYLYSNEGIPITANMFYPELSQINGLSRDLTRLFPLENLVSYYQNSDDNPRFAIPVLTLWENGKIKVKTKNAGSEIYHPDYWKDDEKRIEERAQRDFRGLVKLGFKSIP